MEDYNGKNYLFVLYPSPNILFIIIDDNINKIIKKIQFDEKFNDMELDQFYNKLYLIGSHNLKMYDILKKNSSIEVYNQRIFRVDSASKAVINPINSHLFVVEPPFKRIIVVNPFGDSTDGRYNSYISTDSLPDDIVFDEKSDIGYVSHKGSNTITTFNGTDNTPLYFIKFDVSPENAAKIVCGNLTFKGNSSTFFKPNMECKAIANNGFRLSSMILDNEYNDPTVVNFETTPNSSGNALSKSVVSFWENLQRIFGYNANSANFNITASGEYRFNYIQEQQIPPEFWTPFYGIIASFFVPFIVKEVIDSRRNYKSKILQKKQRQIFVKYQKYLDDILEDHNQITKSSSIDVLYAKIDKFESDIEKEYELANLTEQQYNYFSNEIKSFSKIRPKD